MTYNDHFESKIFAVLLIRDPAAELVYPSSVCSKPSFYSYLRLGECIFTTLPIKMWPQIF